MRKALFPAVAWLFCAALPTTLKAQSGTDANARAYIARFKDLAISEQKRTGMPAAIKLAQGLHETGAGTSRLATLANNHFGMKCKRDWKGETLDHTDDAPNECFRKYSSAEESYRDQGNYLRNNPRYAACFATDVKDYKTWASELRRAGYATNPKYAEKLTRTIEAYNLQQYTLLAAGESPLPVQTEAAPPTVSEVVRQDFKNLAQEAVKVSGKAKDLVVEAARASEKAVESAVQALGKGSEATIETYKGLQGFYAKAGQSLLEEATRYNVRYAKLLEWNDLPDAPVPYDMFVFLEKKPSRGSVATHVVKSGETLHQIAQQEAIQLASLRQLNMLEYNEEPQAGTVLQLQKGATFRPAVYESTDQIAPAVAEARLEALTPPPPPTTETVVTEAAPPPPVTNVPEIAKEAPAPVPAPPATPEPVEETPVKPVADDGFISKAAISESTEAGQQAPIAPVVIETPPSAPETAVASSSDAPTPVSAEITPTSETVVAGETPTSEKPTYDDTPLGRLKAQMDRAVYSKKPDTTTTAEPTSKAVPAAPKSETPAAAGRPAFHKVAKGETVFGIAKKYGVSVTELRKWNAMDFSALKEGQKLKLKP